MEFLVVGYDGDDCGVIIDDVPGGWITNEVLQLSAGHHGVTLSEPAGCFKPIRIEVILNGTTPQQPKVIQFLKTNDAEA
jgi:hypothetical protein